MPKRINFKRTVFSNRFQSSNNQVAPRRPFTVRSVNKNRINNKSNYEQASEPQQRSQRFLPRFIHVPSENKNGFNNTRQRFNGVNREPLKTYGMQRQNLSNNIGTSSQRQNQQKSFSNRVIIVFYKFNNFFFIILECT